MTLPAYTVPGIPLFGASAFTPVPPPANDRGSWWGLVGVQGSPGTTDIPAPDPLPVERGIFFRRGTDRGRQAQFIRPTIYVPETVNMGPQQGAAGVKVLHDEPLPVPAGLPNQIARPVPVKQYPVPRPGGRVIAWPRALLRWRTVQGGTV